MTAVPTVSVIVNCLNGEKFVGAALHSIYAQTFPDWEIVFVDNGSTDATPAIAASFDGRLRYVRNEHTVPLGQARNQALRHARGELIAFLDADDVWFPQKLARQLPLFDDDRVDFVFADTELRFAETGRRISYFEYHRFRPPRGYIFGDLLRHYAIPMLTTVTRARALRAMPEWFDDSFRVCDDFDFFMRLSHRSSCDYVDEMLASCLIHEEAATARLHQHAAGEMRRTLQKLRAAQPDFDQAYGDAARACLRRVDYKEGTSLWIQGRRRDARRLFRHYWRDPKFALSYGAAFFPYGWVDRVRHIAR